MLAPVIIDLLAFCLGMMLTGWVWGLVRTGRAAYRPADDSCSWQFSQD
jgi:hypothetical protein